MRTSSVSDWCRYEYHCAHVCGECLHKSRMREICTSGSPREEGVCYFLAHFLLYSTVFPWLK